MIRKIVSIDSEKCSGCGKCAAACHEGAIIMENNKAKLIKDDYCDGLGDCLPVCPDGAISIIEREAAAYDQKAVDALRKRTGSILNWPVQLKLTPISSPAFQNADLVISADCAGFASEIYNRYFKNNAVLIGCPKLDGADYTAKLTEIIKNNSFKSITLIIMEVPCCRRLEMFVKQALADSGKPQKLNLVIIKTDGSVLSQ